MGISPQQIEKVLRDQEITDYQWIDPTKIVVGQWVRMKCRFGCAEYGRNASCPPNTPSVAECERLFAEYSQAVLIRFEKRVDKPEERHRWSRRINGRLLKAERGAFLAGHHKAFVLFMDSCGLCEDCAPDRAECHNPKSSRPSPESMAVDVFATVRAAGFPIGVLADYDQPMNRYAILLVE